jgi:hypothetical protein
VRPAPHALGHVAAAEHLDLDIEAVALDGVAVSGALQRTLGLQTQG